jgi:hypothetical protein
MLQIYSQRDPRWANIKLGTGTLTIGQAGCTISCVASLAGITPKEVNERLLKVNGYANTNLIIWSKVKEAMPWLEWKHRGYTYDNNQVAQNLPCLVEVDGKRIGAPRHWVLYIGNQKMYDPWYGTEKTTSYYPPVGYAIINRVGNPPGGSMSGAVMYGKPHSYDLNNHDSMKVAVDHLNDILEGRYIKKEDHQKLLNEEIEKRRRAEDEASGFKKTHKEFIADLAGIFETQHNTPEILAASRQAIAYEDNYRELQEIRQKEREEWGKAIFALEGQVQTMRKELEHKDKELDDIKKKIDDLKKETPKEVEVEKPVDKLADRLNRLWDRLWEIIQNSVGGK